MKKLLLFVIIALSSQSIKAQTDAFITTWVTTTGFETITLPVQADAPNYTINWGDGLTNTYTATQVPTHTFINSGEHTVSFTGNFPHLKFIGQTKLKAVQQWGTQKWTSMAYMFHTCSTFNSFPSQAPDLSLCTDISYIFYDAAAFNQPIGNWNVSKVTNMNNMFFRASAFNQPIGSWNVGMVTNMNSMFCAARAFNQPIGSWDVSKVTNMSSMFNSASAFNQPIDTWDVSKVNDMNGMFSFARAFNQPIGSWNVSQVTNMTAMFVDTSFNQPIGSWNVSQVADMRTMFNGASAFNQPLENWNVSNVTNMSNMFNGSSAFNQPIGSWDVSKVTDMSWMFSITSAFNQPIGNWNVSKVTDMNNMFFRASAFNQPIGSWNVGMVTNMNNMFKDTKLSTANYDTTLIGWASKGTNGGVLKSVVTFSGGSSNYCNGLGARNYLINTYKWVITDGGLNCTGLGTDDFDKSNISLYPNPTSNVLNLKADNSITNQPYSISDVLGKVVLKGKLNEGDTTINVEHLTKGIYFIKVANNKASKFIKD